MKTIYISLFISGLFCVTAIADGLTNLKNHTGKSHISFYDKGFLNDPIMQFESNRLRTKMDQHIFSVREGTKGGYDSSGGVCGCN